MKIVKALGLVLWLTGAAFAAAQEDTAARLADVLTSMQHFPSEEQKATLTQIASDEQVDQDLRIIAGAISNIEHQLPEAEQPAVQAIVGDPESSEAAQTLAQAVLRFNHQLAAQDADALQGLGD